MAITTQCQFQIHPTRISPLRRRMLDALQLRGMAPRTQEAYIEAVSRLARHYHRSPERLSADEVQAYLLHLLRERRLSPSSLALQRQPIRLCVSLPLPHRAGAGR